MSEAAPRKLQSLSANQKKISALMILLALALLLWGRLLWTQQIPRSVLAHPEEEAAAPVGPADPVPANPVPARTPIYVDLPQDLQRDLFAFNSSDFGGQEAAAAVPQPQGKSGPQPADDRQRAARGLRGLVLQSTILGEPARAVISGQVLVAGDRIGGFTLRRIERREVVLEMNGIEVRLGM
jgi:hypothetical protein